MTDGQPHDDEVGESPYRSRQTLIPGAEPGLLPAATPSGACDPACGRTPPPPEKPAGRVTPTALTDQPGLIDQGSGDVRSGESLRLEGVELGLRDRPGVQQR